MKYDFTSLMNRSGHDAIAVDQIPIPGAEVKEGFSLSPIHIAADRGDMDTLRPRLSW